MSIADLQKEIDRVKELIAEINNDPAKPFCPPSKGISGEVGHLYGLSLRQLVLEDALLFVELGPPQEQVGEERVQNG